MTTREGVWLLASGRGHKTVGGILENGVWGSDEKRHVIPEGRAWEEERQDAGEHLQAPFPLLRRLTSALRPPALKSLGPCMLRAGAIPSRALSSPNPRHRTDIHVHGLGLQWSGMWARRQ